MQVKKHTSEKKEKNVVEALLHRYLPYWPLFMLLLLAGFLAGYFYLKMTTPIYSISANILIKDEKKGADESRLLEALDVYAPNKIVENEIEVIKSKDLLRKLIDSLHLYAPTFEDGTFIPVSAYTTSPISIKVANKENMPSVNRIDFDYNNRTNTVVIEGKQYPIDKWVTTPFGDLKFVSNPNFKSEAKDPLYFSLVPPDKVLNNLSSRLSISSAGKLSTVLYLTLKDAVPERGKDILNLLIKVYNLEAINDKSLMASNTLAFVEGRIRYVVKELDSIENRLQQFRTENGVVNLSEQSRIYLQTVGENDKKTTELDMQLAMLNEVEKYVRSKDNQVGIVPSITGVRDALLSSLLQKLFDSQVQYERLKKTIPIGNPTMVSLENEIENLRPRILENIQNQRLTLMASKNNLLSRTGLYTSMLQTIPKNEKDLLDISRQQAIKNDVYSFLLQKREEAALSFASSVANSRTIEQAYASSGPVSPQKKFVMGVALSVALLLGFGMISSKEVLSNKILFRSDIEELTNIPIIAEIARIKGRYPLFIDIDKHPNFIEQFRQLRATLALNNRPAKYKKILVTSGIVAEGKSFISNNLALSIAMSGRKVALVDMDLRSPKISMLHNLEDKRGVSDFLENDNVSINEIVYTTNYPTLFLLPAGTAKANPTELLLNGNLEKLFNYLDKSFEFVIIDTSPIDPLTDAYVLTEYCDSTLFVIRHDYTPKAMVELVEESHKVNALKNISIVFNGIKPRGFLKSSYGYGYGYGARKVYKDQTYMGRNLTTRA